MQTSGVDIHPSAEVSSDAQIGGGTRIWHHAHIRERAVIGENCTIGKDVYVDVGVVVGSNVKIQNASLLYHGARLEDGVMLGPQVCLTNDRFPRAITPDGRLKNDDDWEVGPIVVRYGAALGAGVIVLPGVTIGRWAMAGAGALVTRDVPDHGLVVGAPARLIGYVCSCGHRLVADSPTGDGRSHCDSCGLAYHIPGVAG